MRVKIMLISCTFSIFLLIHTQLLAQKKQTTDYQAYKIAGLPNINYDADDGFGYGARVDFFGYGKGGYNPYYFLIDLQAFATTGGKREFWLFFDSPFILGKGKRLTGEIRFARSNYSPFFGIGQSANYNENLIDDAEPEFINEHYYTYRRSRFSARLDYQRDFKKVKSLIGFAINHSDIEQNDGETLFGRFDQLRGKEGGWTNMLKFGIIYDSRDFEPNPTRGMWSDVIYELYAPWLGSDYNLSRVVVSHRYYLEFFSRLVLAQRLIYSYSWGKAPFYAHSFMPSIFRIEEGIGGAKSVRGVLKSRYIGPEWLVGNLELRYPIFSITKFGQDFDFILSTFFDFGGAWSKAESMDAEGLATGRGAGLHVAWNRNFIVACDVATGDEVGLAIYIGLGFLY